MKGDQVLAGNGGKPLGSAHDRMVVGKGAIKILEKGAGRHHLGLIFGAGQSRLELVLFQHNFRGRKGGVHQDILEQFQGRAQILFQHGQAHGGEIIAPGK